MSQSPGRYQTSVAGMVGAMIVLVGCVLAFVVFRETTRDVPQVEPEAMDWKTSVVSIQGQGHEVVHPADLEDGWIATTIEFRPTKPVTFGLNMLTEEGRFVGLRQEDQRLEDLLATFVDDEAVEGDPVRIGGDLGGEWQTFTDEGGDTALVLDRKDDYVMVFGSASRTVLVDFASTLTLDELEK